MAPGGEKGEVLGNWGPAAIFFGILSRGLRQVLGHRTKHQLSETMMDFGATKTLRICFLWSLFCSSIALALPKRYNSKIFSRGGSNTEMSAAMEQKKRVLVAGGAGYIGTHTLIELLTAGERVVVVDNLCNSDIESLSRVREITGVRHNNY